MPGGIRGTAGLVALALLAGCARVIPAGEGTRPVTPPPPSAHPTSALDAGLARGPRVAALKLSGAEAGSALTSFIESCPKLLIRADGSGLTRPGDWEQACTDATQTEYNKAAEFFATHFETAKIGNGQSFATGYFEPEIEGSRTRRDDFAIPVYRLPPDLVHGWPESVPPDQRTGRGPLGRYDEHGRFVPYYDRAAIEAGALAGEHLEIAWVADWADYYFLQVQGSGRLRTPEGEVIELGYAGKNGYEYTGIGSLMRQRGLIGSGPGQYPGTMDGIKRYLREHPDDGRALMRENRSWVFFRETGADGPAGALGVPLHANSSLAVDPAFVPLGAPVWLKLDNARANGLWVAQDTGGAIKGANRFDTFWGAGDDARVTAGGMSAHGQALVLLPMGTLDRLGVR